MMRFWNGLSPRRQSMVVLTTYVVSIWTLVAT